MATLTLTTAHPMQPKYGPNKTITAHQTYVSSATVSNTDVYIFGDLRIPHGAEIMGIVGRGSCVDGTYIFELGMGGSNGVADVFGSLTLSATAAIVKTVVTALPYTVSVSDDAAYRYQTVQLRCDGAPTSACISVSIDLSVTYITR